MTDVKILSANEVEKKLNNEKNFYFWNVLSEDSFNGELIPGSNWVPLERIGRKVKEEQIPQDKEIVVYCGSQSCPQSTKAVEKLYDLGYYNVYDYEGGIKEWKETGHGTEKREQ